MENAVTLRKLTEHDSQLIVEWRNDNRAFFPAQDEFTIGSQLAWYRSAYANAPADHCYIVVVNHWHPAGTISFDSQTREVGRVMLGDKRWERQGVMSQALRLLVRTFGGDGRYWLRVLSTNHRAISFYERNGFRSLPPSGDGMTYMERTA